MDFPKKKIIIIKQYLNLQLESQQDLILELYNNLHEIQQLFTTYYNQYFAVSQEANNLQDLILDLEVEKFNNLQDLSILETRLLKYQNLLKSNEACNCGLKDELRNLRSQNQKLEQMINYLQNELGRCKSDLVQLEKVLQSGTLVEEEHQKFVQTITELQSALHLVQTQLSAKSKELLREKKISDINTTRIEELQGIITQKTYEITKWTSAFNDIKRQHELAVLQMKAQQNTINDLENKYERSQKTNNESCAQSQMCQQEITACLINLQSLKEKIKGESELLDEKTMQYEDLKSMYTELSKRHEQLACEFDKAETGHNEEILEYKHTMRELNDQLNKTELNLSKLSEDYEISQQAISDANQREVKLRQDFGQREHVLSEKLHHSQNEEMRLIDYTSQLENELLNLKDVILSKEKQLETTKANLNKIKCNCSSKLAAAQEEINRLKNEVNMFMQRQDELITENNDLAAQVTSLRAKGELIESRNEIVKEQMGHCLIEIQRIQIEKDSLQQRNDELQRDVKLLHNAINDVNRECQCKIESVMMELVDTKASREEVCSESRSVVQNVRLWIQEQKKINDKLCGKLKERNCMIARLREENEALANSAPNLQAQRVPTGKICKFKRGETPPPCASGWGGSQGSTSTDRDSPRSDVSNVEVQWYAYTAEPGTCSTDEDQQMIWIEKTESFTMDMQKANCAWRNRLGNP